jgi:hypothetical protein
MEPLINSNNGINDWTDHIESVFVVISKVLDIIENPLYNVDPPPPH